MKQHTKSYMYKNSIIHLPRSAVALDILFSNEATVGGSIEIHSVLDSLYNLKR